MLIYFQMISTRYASFLCGIAIASVTWAFSLYLYSRLSQNTNAANPTMYVSEFSKTLKESVFDQRSNHLYAGLSAGNTQDKIRKGETNGKDEYNSKGKKKYQDSKNSNKLLQQLQPVPVKPAVTIGQGMNSR